MNPVRVYVVVEGETEERFVRAVLAPAFSPGIDLRACLIGMPGAKGGCVKWSRLRFDLRRLLQGDRAAFATTLFDYYGMGRDFPGNPFPQTDICDRRRAVEQGMVSGLEEFGVGSQALRRFVPYVQMHEFEGILFSNPTALAEGILAADNRGLPAERFPAPILIASLEAIRGKFHSPEHINDGKTTAPSKRLASLYPGYDKVSCGYQAALKIGLHAMRACCANFNDWLTKLEALE